MEELGANHNKLEEAATWNKEKPPSLCETNDIDRHLIVLSSVNFYLKQTTPLIVGREMDYN